MKIYYYDAGWNLISAIVDYPNIQCRNNMHGLCLVTLRDFEGALYDTWYSRDFTEMKIEDDSSNILFRGYLINKKFHHDSLTLELIGFSIALEWYPFNQNYILAQGKVKTVNASAVLDLYDDISGDGDGEYDAGEDFSWDADQWIGERDVGILIVDETTGSSTISWDASDETCTNGVQTGDFEDTLDKWANWLVNKESKATNPTYLDSKIVLDIDGAVIPDTNYLKKITVNYRFRVKGNAPIEDDVVVVYMRLYLKKAEESNTLIKQIYLNYTGAGWSETTVQGSFEIEDINTELLKYFDKTGADYTSLHELYFETSGGIYSDDAAAYVESKVDYIKVDVEYNPNDIAPIMLQITDNAVSNISCAGTTWTSTGVQVNDNFKIGENSTVILEDIASTAGLAIEIRSTLSKYVARHFKGVHCIDALMDVCRLEGLDWMEDYINNRIIVSKPTDFIDSGVDLDSTDYEWDWEFEDKCNQIRQVEVWGNAAYNIYAVATDDSVSGDVAKQIINDNIMTVADAQAVADAELLKLKTKRPSIKLTLNGTNNAIQLGTYVGITFVRPTIGAADYPLRMIHRGVKGINGIKTIIYAGLGETDIDEKIGKTIRDVAFLAHKNLSDKLTSTPWSQGAIISYGDIVGFSTGVTNIIDAEIVGGQSIDNAIDALIATHHLSTSTDHDDRYYKKSGIFDATYNFKHEEVKDHTADPTALAFVDAATLYNGTLVVVSSWQNHKNVLRLQDDATAGEDPWIRHNETQATAGTREFWIGTNNITEKWRFGLYEDGNDYIIALQITASNLDYFDSVDVWQTIQAVANDTLYHIKVVWRADNTFDLYVNGTKKVDNQATNNNQVAGPTYFFLSCEGDSTDYMYLDAYGDPDNDADYTVGDNHYLKVFVS